MTRIELISDTHNYLDESVFHHFEKCNEIWHAGDFGNIGLAEELAALKPLKGVYGNIDGQDVRSVYPQKLVWTCEGVTVYMTHIGGYPNKYAPGIKQDLIKNKAGLFICGHSHILKIVYDQSLQCLHMNPGAAGNQGWHQVRTLIRFAIDGKEKRNCLHMNPGAAGKQGWQKVRTIVRFAIDGKEIKDCEVIELGKRGQ
jgi:putative phosphoesterase